MRQTTLRALLVALLIATGIIHWLLPLAHPVIVPGEWTGGVVRIPHSLLHLLFNLNGIGYLVLAGIVAGWLPIKPRHQPWLYAVVIGFAGLTILAWVLLSAPPERTILDYSDKLIELGIIAAALQMLRALAAAPAGPRPG